MRRHLIDSRLGQMHVRTTEGTGAPLLLLHTQMLGGSVYDGVIPFLEAAGRRLIVPDRVGFGLSDPAPRPLGFAEYAQATVDVLDALDAGECDLVGIHSGSFELVELAVSYPERVRSGAIISTMAPTPEAAAEKKAAVQSSRT